MKTPILTSIALATMLGLSPVVQADDLEARAASARDASAQLLEELKGMVTKAARAKGPVWGVKTCNLNARKKTKMLSEKLGMEIGRTSHKLRQPKNAPDEWEKGVLQSFLDRKAKGEDLKTMEYYEVVEANGEKTFRYMKAIPLGGVCFNCHGTAIRPKTKAMLDELYPNDKARGMSVGDLRGAFTIKQKM